VNILFVDQFSEPGGAQLALLDLMGEVLRRQWKPRIMAPGFGALLKRASFAGIPVRNLPLRPLTNGRKGVADLCRYLADLPRVRQEIERVISEHHIDLLYVNGPRLLPAAAGFDLPVIFHAHSYVNGFASRRLAMHAVRTAGATVIAASRFAAAEFETVSAKPVHVIYNGAPDLGGNRFPSPDGKVRIGIVGRIAPEKGHADFVRAAKLLGGDKARFTIYGDSFFSVPDYESKLRALAADSPVSFEPWRDDIGDVFRELDIVAVPSHANEVSTRVVMEAFSTGVAVVAYPSGGIPELINHGRTGLLIQHPDSQGLAAALRTLCDRPEMRSELAQAARAEWEKRFTRRQFQTAVCDVIEQVAGGIRKATYSDRDAQSMRAAECRPDRTTQDAAVPQ
jgi:glycosyltransferase involved in cell wall biosynthesis